MLIIELFKWFITDQVMDGVRDIFCQGDKVVEDYASRTRQLDQILDDLTKDFCRRCSEYQISETKPCCKSRPYPPYHMSGATPELLEHQKKEARANGVEPVYRRDFCNFLTENGCVLKVYKSPVCIGYMCFDLEEHLNKEFGEENVKPFAENMKMIKRAGYINPLLKRNPQVLFEFMDEAIEYGLVLVEIKHSKL